MLRLGLITCILLTLEYSETKIAFLTPVFWSKVVLFQQHLVMSESGKCSKFCMEVSVVCSNEFKHLESS